MQYSFLLLLLLLTIGCASNSRNLASIVSTKSNLPNFASVAALSGDVKDTSEAFGFHQKKDMIVQLDACSNSCETVAMEFLKKIAQTMPRAIIETKATASYTLVYLYSDPTETQKEDRIFLKSMLDSKNEANIIALPYITVQSARHKNMAKEWIVEAELSIKIAHALGLRTVLKAGYIGGSTAAYIASKYPNLIDKLILQAPALILPAESKYDYNDGYSEFLRSNFSSKNLSDADDDETDGLPADSYALAMDQISNWAKAIPVKTLLSYSASDEIVDTQALNTFAENLSNARVVVYPKSQHIDHHASLDTEMNMDLIESFIQSH